MHTHSRYESSGDNLPVCPHSPEYRQVEKSHSRSICHRRHITIFYHERIFPILYSFQLNLLWHGSIMATKPGARVHTLKSHLWAVWISSARLAGRVFRFRRKIDPDQTLGSSGAAQEVSHTNLALSQPDMGRYWGSATIRSLRQSLL